MMIIDNAFNIGDTIYIRMDKDQQPRMVTLIYVGKDFLRYLITNGYTDTVHYDFELSLEKNIILATTN